MLETQRKVVLVDLKRKRLIFERFTERAREILTRANEEADYFSHGYIGTEHLLLGLLREDKGVAARALASLNVTYDAVHEQVESIVGYGLLDTFPQKTLTPRSNRILQLASHDSASLGHNYIGTEHILLAIVRENEGVASRILSNLYADPNQIHEHVFRILGHSPQSSRFYRHPPRTKLPQRTAVEVPAKSTISDGPVQLFYSYSHKDERFRGQLETHLTLLRRQDLIRDWHFRKIPPGREWEGAIDQNLESAEIVLLLVSADFVGSDYCYDIELNRALDKHESGEARVIPVIIRPTDWTGTPFRKLQALPKDAKPVTKWANRDDAWLNIATGIRKVVNELREQDHAVE
jgi:hypothetical protein